MSQPLQSFTCNKSCLRIARILQYICMSKCPQVHTFDDSNSQVEGLAFLTQVLRQKRAETRELPRCYFTSYRSSSSISTESAVSWRWTKHRSISCLHSMKPSAAGLEGARTWTATMLVQSRNAIVVHFLHASLRPGVVQRDWVQNGKDWVRNRSNIYARA